jgi:chromosome partitioning protein
MQKLIIAIVATKGGVGKSLIAANLAAISTAQGRKPVIIDADPQGSVAEWCGFRKQQDVLQIPCSCWTNPGNSVSHLATVVRPDWDLAVIDVQGSDNAFLRAALLVSDLVLVPTAPTVFDFRALNNHTLPLLTKVSKQLNAKAVGRIVINKWMTRYTFHLQIRNQITTLGTAACASTIRQSEDINKASAFGLGVAEFSPKSGIAADFTNLYTELKTIIPL